MNTFTKRTLGTGTALAALFVGASCSATPASAFAPSALLHSVTAPLFAQHFDSDRNHDAYGNHSGWVKIHGRWVRRTAQSRYGSHSHLYSHAGSSSYHPDDYAAPPGVAYHYSGDNRALPGDLPPHNGDNATQTGGNYHHSHDINGNHADTNNTDHNQYPHDHNGSH